MNTILEDEYPGNHELRDQMFDILTDEDLAYQLPGNNLTLGQLIEEMGRFQQIYTKSFETFEQDWLLEARPPEPRGSVAGLKEWFATLDAEMVAALGGLAEDDVQNKQIDRGHGFTPSPFVQFQIYHEAILIFCAKASIYLRALEKPLPPQWRSWIG